MSRVRPLRVEWQRQPEKRREQLELVALFERVRRENALSWTRHAHGNVTRAGTVSAARAVGPTVNSSHRGHCPLPRSFTLHPSARLSLHCPLQFAALHRSGCRIAVRSSRRSKDDSFDCATRLKEGTVAQRFAAHQHDDRQGRDKCCKRIKSPTPLRSSHPNSYART